jgi:hypothetical protein
VCGHYHDVRAAAGRHSQLATLLAPASLTVSNWLYVLPSPSMKRYLCRLSLRSTWPASPAPSVGTGWTSRVAWRQRRRPL